MEPYEQFSHLMELFHGVWKENYTNFAGASVPLGLFPNPRCLIKALHRSIDENVAGYVSALGPSKINKLIADYENARIGQEILGQDNVALIPGSSTGAISYVLDYIFHDSIGEMLVSVPNYWLPFEYMSRKIPNVNVRKIQGRVENGFLPSLEQIAENISDKTKAIFLCNPLNPSGKIHSEEELAEIISLARKHNLYVISDEACYDLMYPNFSFPSITKAGQNYERSIIVRTWSKDRGRPDMSLGYIISSPELFEERKRGVIYDNPGRFFLEFIEVDMNMRLQMLQNSGDNGEDSVDYRKVILENIQKFQRNVSYAIKVLRQCRYVDDVIVPQGGFTVFFHIKHPQVESGYQFVQDLFHKMGVTSLPGSTLGMENDPPWIRLSLTCALHKPDREIKGAPNTYVDYGLEKLCEYLGTL